MDLAHWIERHAAFAPHRAAIRFAGEDITYRDLNERVALMCGRLVSLGVTQGDRIAFLGFNHPDMLALLFACARLGAMLLPLNWRLAAPEHARILGDCTPRLVLVEDAFLGHAETLREGGQGVGQWLSLGEAAGWRSFADAPAHAAAEAGPADENCAVLLCYTSGSTGMPKGAVLTQRALLWNAINSAHMHDLTGADRILTTLPMFHVGGLNIQTLPALHAGACVTLHAKFDPEEAIAAIERERITLAVFVPAQLTAMMEHPRWESADLSSLRVVTTGSTIVSDEFVRRVHARGLRLIQVYGSTETCPIASYLRVEDAERKAGAAGLPALHCELRVADADGRDLPAGRDGEILVRGANVMREYWNAPQATAEALRGGWYHSGDIGHFDEEGYLHVVSRKNDMIISGGENIYPAELENILMESPSIAETCIVGRLDERWGQIVVAVIVLREGAAMSEADVLALFDGRVARYKHPRQVVFVEALPRNALGKVKREELRNALAQAVAA